jgi:acyltransferase
MASKVSAKRFDYVDIARFYGIFLVYYGHVVERFMYLKIEAAALQYKYIYSFHMVLFFFLSGMVISEKTLKLSFVDFIKKKFKTRVIPYLFFNFILLVYLYFCKEIFLLFH